MSQISIVIPVYNAECYLERCIDSILAQTFKDFDLILVDDGSTDESGKICDEFVLKDKRIHTIHQINGGVSAARNAGIEWSFLNSESEWISFIDSDDWVHRLYLERLINAAITLSTEIAVCGLKRAKTVNDEIELTGEVYSLSSSKLYNYYAHKIVNVSACGKLFRKKCFQSIRFPIGKQWEDLATIYKLLLAVPECAVIRDELYYYYINENGTVLRPWNPSRMDEFDAYEEQLEFFSGRAEFKGIFETLQKTYIHAISYSYYMEQKSDLSPAEKKYYAAVLRKKIRSALKKYRKTAGIRFQDDKAVYDTAYPKLMQLYWIIQSRIERLKRE